MSNIIDLLKKDHIDHKTQERLAETYFPLSDEAAKDSKAPSDIPSPISHDIKKKVPLAITPFSIVLLILCAILLYAFLTYTVKVNIMVTKKVPSPYEDLLVTQKIDSFGAVFNENGHISLMNSDTKRGTALMIDLDKPVDLSNKYVLISAMPKTNGGRVNVILRDKNYRSYISDTLNIRDNKKEWQNFMISAQNGKESIDIQKIQHMRLELVNNKMENMDSPAIYIKKIALIDN